MRSINKYYKKHYIIGIYTADELELCVAVLDNAHEFAKYLGIDVIVANTILHRCWNKETHYIKTNNQHFLVHFIYLE